MTLIIGKSKPLVPKDVKIIKYTGHTEQKAIEMTKQIAKDFGEQSKRNPPKKRLNTIYRSH